jgi:hypothetical protein
VLQELERFQFRTLEPMRSVNLLDDRGGLFVPYGYRRIRKVRLLGI